MDVSLAYSLFARDPGDTPGALSRGRRSHERAHEDVRHDGLDARERMLVEQVRAGDSTAFKAVYVEHYVDLLEFAYSLLRARDEAEDVVQQVFAELWERRMAWHPHRIGPSLVRSVRHRALDVLRKTRRQVDGETPDIIPSFTATDATLEYDELERALVSALNGLPERRRTALILRAVRQMSYAEIGDILDVSEKAAFILVSRARAALEPVRARFLSTGRIAE